MTSPAVEVTVSQNPQSVPTVGEKILRSAALGAVADALKSHSESETAAAQKAVQEFAHEQENALNTRVGASATAAQEVSTKIVTWYEKLGDVLALGNQSLQETYGTKYEEGSKRAAALITDARAANESLRAATEKLPTVPAYDAVRALQEKLDKKCEAHCAQIEAKVAQWMDISGKQAAIQEMIGELVDGLSKKFAKGHSQKGTVAEFEDIVREAYGPKLADPLHGSVKTEVIDAAIIRYNQAKSLVPGLAADIDAVIGSLKAALDHAQDKAPVAVSTPPTPPVDPEPVESVPGIVEVPAAAAIATPPPANTDPVPATTIISAAPAAPHGTEPPPTLIAPPPVPPVVTIDLALAPAAAEKTPPLLGVPPVIEVLPENLTKAPFEHTTPTGGILNVKFERDGFGAGSISHPALGDEVTFSIPAAGGPQGGERKVAIEAFLAALDDSYAKKQLTRDQAKDVVGKLAKLGAVFGPVARVSPLAGVKGVTVHEAPTEPTAAAIEALLGCGELGTVHHAAHQKTGVFGKLQVALLYGRPMVVLVANGEENYNKDTHSILRLLGPAQPTPKHLVNTVQRIAKRFADTAESLLTPDVVTGSELFSSIIGEHGMAVLSAAFVKWLDLSKQRVPYAPTAELRGVRFVGQGTTTTPTEHSFVGSFKLIDCSIDGGRILIKADRSVEYQITNLTYHNKPDVEFGLKCESGRGIIAHSTLTGGHTHGYLTNAKVVHSELSGKNPGLAVLLPGATYEQCAPKKGSLLSSDSIVLASVK